VALSFDKFGVAFQLVGLGQIDSLHDVRGRANVAPLDSLNTHLQTLIAKVILRNVLHIYST